MLDARIAAAFRVWFVLLSAAAAHTCPMFGAGFAAALGV